LTASEPAADKSRYNFFNPTPRELMRDLSADRPDLTESPYTVDAGHFQIEMDLVNYSHDRHNRDRETIDSYSVAAVNLKAGLLNNVDLQLILEPYISTRIKDRSTGSTSKHNGFGDITTRLKVNLWGNDGGETALALMPFIKLPTNQDDVGNEAVEGGLIVPFAMELPAGWGLGAQTEVDFIEDGDEDGYHAEFINTVALGRDIVGNLAGYVEFFSLVSTESDSDWIGSVNGGLTYAVNADLQLDGGVNFGVTRAADDITPFVGVTWRY
jgi:hypothetical protein